MFWFFLFSVHVLAHSRVLYMLFCGHEMNIISCDFDTTGHMKPGHVWPYRHSSIVRIDNHNRLTHAQFINKIILITMFFFSFLISVVDVFLGGPFVFAVKCWKKKSIVGFIKYMMRFDWNCVGLKNLRKINYFCRKMCSSSWLHVCYVYSFSEPRTI